MAPFWASFGANGAWGASNGYFWGDGTADGVSTFAASLGMVTNDTGLPSSDFQPLTQAGPVTFNEPALLNIPNPFIIQGTTTAEITGPYAVFSTDPAQLDFVTPVPEPSSLMLIAATCARWRCCEYSAESSLTRPRVRRLVRQSGIAEKECLKLFADSVAALPNRCIGPPLLALLGLAPSSDFPRRCSSRNSCSPGVSVVAKSSIIAETCQSEAGDSSAARQRSKRSPGLASDIRCENTA